MKQFWKEALWGLNFNRKEVLFCLIICILFLSCVTFLAMYRVSENRKEQETCEVYGGLPMALVPARCVDWFD